MGIAVQHSCYVAQTTSVKHEESQEPPHACWDATQSAEEVMDDLLDETQTVALTMLLEPGHFSKDGKLEAEFNEVEARLFPPSFDTQRAKRIFRKLRLNVLQRSVHNDQAHLPAGPITGKALLRYIHNDRIQDSVLQCFRDKFPCLLPGLDKVRTWRQLCNLVMKVPGGKDIQEDIMACQVDCARLDLGLPWTAQLNMDEGDEELIQTGLESSEPAFFDDEHVKDLICDMWDLVIVRAAETSEENGLTAYERAHIITLNHIFFSNLARRMSDNAIVPGVTYVYHYSSGTRLQAFLHELLHVSSVADLEDQSMTAEDEEEVRAYEGRSEIKDTEHATKLVSTESKIAYGIYRCAALRTLDEIYDTYRAEENCDSWSLSAVLKQSILANPEYDFLNGDKITLREKLLHHCSLFQCMRPKDSVPIKELAGYDPEQDLRAKQHEDWVPANPRELLQAVKQMVDDAGINLESMLIEARFEPLR
ncbi:hypothetical protein PMZ80_008920 [Knufia obscura]|nr:hypothetical protein PMZ80_008920 [Knufia obscura]